MAVLPKTPCRKCGVATVNRNYYCDAHQSLVFGWVKTQAGRTTKQRGYAGNWPRLVAQVKRRDKVCVICNLNGFCSPAQEVDHIKPKSRGGTDDLVNLQGLCRPCHKAKTQREARQGRQSAMWEGESKSSAPTKI